MAEHRITPPPDLVQHWGHEANLANAHWTDENWAYEMFIAHRAAQWGCDQELDACEVVIENYVDTETAELLRNVRRPKPPSLKQKALEILSKEHECGSWERGSEYRISAKDADTLRQALEQLDD
jgi:hypothetical protein